MTASACHNVDGFVDGELSPREMDEFQIHLGDCLHCPGHIEERLALRAWAETVSLPKLESSTARVRFRRLVLGPVLLVPVAAVAALLFWPSSSNEAWVIPAQRPFEARIPDKRADEYRPFDPVRGQTLMDVHDRYYAELAKLQEADDLAGMVNLSLLNADLKQARTLVDSASKEENSAGTLRRPRAVLALLNHDPRTALDQIEVPGAKRTPVDDWNRGLALRDLGLPRAAARAFEAVASVGEVGWAEEAQTLVEALTAQADQRREAMLEAERHARQWVQDRILPPNSQVDRWPQLFRGALYDAVRSADSKAEVQSLRPVAQRLDGLFQDGQLTGLVDRFSAFDPQQRAALSASTWDDPWLVIEQTRAAVRNEAHDAPRGGVLSRLRECVAQAADAGFAWLRLDLELDIVAHYLDQGATDKSLRLGEHVLQAAQAEGAYRIELRALSLLARGARSVGQSSLARAFSQERDLHAP